MNVAETPQLFKHPLYQTIRSVIADLVAQNLITNGAGFCWAVSDLLHHRLKASGINSRIIETELTIISDDPPTFTVVGHQNGMNRFGNVDSSNKISTHVVLLIEDCDQPLLLDCSISHLLPDPFTWVCAPITTDGYEYAIINRGPIHLTYRPKTGDKLPVIHERTVLDRIYLDQRLNKMMSEFALYRRLFWAMKALLVLVFVADFYVTKNASDLGQANQTAISIISAQLERNDRLTDRVEERLIDLQTQLLKQK